MQDKIVIAVDKNFCKGCDTCLHEPRIVAICNLRKNLDIDLQVEKTPESFDEIKQLLHDNKDVFNKSVKKIEISEFMIEIHFKLQTVCFLHNGDIVEPNCLRPIVTRRTPEQMWQIIKSFIGE